MQPITFPDDELSLEAAAELKTPEHEHHHHKRGKGSIKYREHQEIIFKHGGTLSRDNAEFFTQPLPEGYFGQHTHLYSAAALAAPGTIKLKFNEENGGPSLYFQLDLES
ncbi:MAG: hypothetical protein NVS9B15_09420 [Acidobacteriaceae bacterium]